MADNYKNGFEDEDYYEILSSRKKNSPQNPAQAGNYRAADGNYRQQRAGTPGNNRGGTRPGGANGNNGYYGGANQSGNVRSTGYGANGAAPRQGVPRQGTRPGTNGGQYGNGTGYRGQAGPARTGRPVNPDGTRAGNTGGGAQHQSGTKYGIRMERADINAPAAQRPPKNPDSYRSGISVNREQSMNTGTVRAVKGTSKKKSSFGSVFTSGSLRSKKSFRKGFLIYTGVLVILMIAAFIYVSSVLKEYENAQPEVVAEKFTEKVRSSALAGDADNFRRYVNLDGLLATYEPDEQALHDYISCFAEGTYSFKKSHSGLDIETSVFDMYLNGIKIGTLGMRSHGEKTKLGLFTMNDWKVETIEATEYIKKFPSNVTVSAGGNPVTGTPSEESGYTDYLISSLFGKDITMTDSLGNEIKYDGKTDLAFKEYSVEIPSTYYLFADGKPVDVSKAVLTDTTVSKDLQDLTDYITLPRIASYNICTVDTGTDIEFIIRNEQGADVEPVKRGGKLCCEYESKTSDTMPEGIINPPDPMIFAKNWRFFMSQDLQGPSNGFYTLAEYLINGSELYQYAWKYANSIDITFTSDHTLDANPFSEERVCNFIKYSDICFSCDVHLEMPMNLSNGMRKEERLDETLYFVYKDDTEDDGIDNPHWGVIAMIGTVDN